MEKGTDVLKEGFAKIQKVELLWMLSMQNKQELQKMLVQ